MYDFSRLFIGATTAALLSAAPARADCLAYIIDICNMSGEIGDGFWVGEYEVEAGPGVLTTSYGTNGIPPAGMQPATVFQMGEDLVIQHPERELNADLVGVADEDPEWTSAPSSTGANLAELVYVEAGCSSQRLPRWTAPTHSEDGIPMRLDLVGVSPTAIVGRLSAEGVQDGTPFTYLRHIRMSRTDFPYDQLDEMVLPNALCEAQCGGGAYYCPDYE